MKLENIKPHERPCVNCHKITTDGKGWFLRGYYGLTGYYCSKCHDMVAHDPDGNPKQPEMYTYILLKQ